jgi:hypothetical protein
MHVQSCSNIRSASTLTDASTKNGEENGLDTNWIQIAQTCSISDNMIAIFSGAMR